MQNHMLPVYCRIIQRSTIQLSFYNYHGQQAVPDYTPTLALVS